MRKISLSLVLAAITLAGSVSTAIGGGTVVRETREVPEFSSVVLNGISTVRIHQGPVQSVTVTIDENLSDRYETVVKDGKLFIGYKFSIFFCLFGGAKDCEVEITVPHLDGVICNGLGKIAVDPFDYDTLNVELNGSAKVELQGTAAMLDVRSTGAAKLLARQLVATNSKVGLTGASHVEVFVEKELDASVSGAGDILYWGDPEVTSSIVGAGGIHRGKD